MNHRFDALITASNIVTKLPELVLEKDDGRVITTGKFDVYPNGANVIPDRVVFTMDLPFWGGGIYPQCGQEDKIPCLFLPKGSDSNIHSPENIYEAKSIK